MVLKKVFYFIILFASTSTNEILHTYADVLPFWESDLVNLTGHHLNVCVSFVILTIITKLTIDILFFKLSFLNKRKIRFLVLEGIL